MSYDLYFYKKNDSKIATETLAKYLSDKQGTRFYKELHEWGFNNEDTEVDFSFRLNREAGLAFPDFTYTGFSFSMQYMRPCFFGLEAFPVVDQLIHDFDLYICEADGKPYQPEKNALYENWRVRNLQMGEAEYSEGEELYIPERESNKVWAYNVLRNKFQEQLGTKYFVPKVFYAQHKDDANVVTITSWTTHIPTVIPDADYYMLHQLYKKFFIIPVKTTAIISKLTLMSRFGQYFDNFNHPDCRIIHPEQAGKIAQLFNTTKGELPVGTLEMLEAEDLTNVNM